MQFDNVGSENVELSDLIFYYFYSSGDAEPTDQVLCNAVNVQAGSCNGLILETSRTSLGDATANRVVTFRFNSGEVPAMTATGAVMITVFGNGPYDRTDDFSFQSIPTDTSNFSLCAGVLVTNGDGVTLWGLHPSL